jgi:putative membrane protein
MKQDKPFQLMLLIATVFFIWSAIKPYDYGVWIFELALGLIGIGILIITYSRFRFSGLVYILVGIHFAVLAIGAKYTYAEMPLFNWLRDTFHLSRNHYDRVGHFMQGFVPALIVREVLLRKTPLKPGGWLSFLCISVCLGFSAFYELLEWWMVIFIYPKEGANWLGLQGDIFDAQGDMFMALIGATLAILLLSRAHDRSIKKIPNSKF